MAARKRQADRRPKRSASKRAGGRGKARPKRKAASRATSRRSGAAARKSGSRRKTPAKARKPALKSRRRPTSRPGRPSRTTASRPSPKPAKAPTPAVAAPSREAPAAAPKPRAARPTPAPKAKSGILERERRRLPDDEREEGTRPAADDPQLRAARSGHDELRSEILKHTETSPKLTSGDVDARWQDAYAIGDEAPGGDNPTPDQDRVDDIGRALGITYQDDQELEGGEEVASRDRHRWELDPASAEDWPHEDETRDRDEDEE